MTSASGVDPQISVANARIQANRVAAERNMPVDRVLALDRRPHRPTADSAFSASPASNVLELNIALDREAPR